MRLNLKHLLRSARLQNLKIILTASSFYVVEIIVIQNYTFPEYEYHGVAGEEMHQVCVQFRKHPSSKFFSLLLGVINSSVSNFRG